MARGKLFCFAYHDIFMATGKASEQGRTYEAYTTHLNQVCVNLGKIEDHTIIWLGKIGSWLTAMTTHTNRTALGFQKWHKNSFSENPMSQSTCMIHVMDVGQSNPYSTPWQEIWRVLSKPFMMMCWVKWDNTPPYNIRCPRFKKITSLPTLQHLIEGGCGRLRVPWRSWRLPQFQKGPQINLQIRPYHPGSVWLGNQSTGGCQGHWHIFQVLD